MRRARESAAHRAELQRLEDDPEKLAALQRKVLLHDVDKLVVIKRLWPHLADDLGAQERMRLEAQLVSGIRHPNVCQVLNLISGPQGPLVVLEYLEGVAREIFPRGFSWDYSGGSRQYAQQGSALLITFFMSILVIYLVLAAQFESWRDPVIILSLGKRLQLLVSMRRWTR